MRPRPARFSSSPVPAAGGARVILLHADAPPKPPEGAACNGCGACCALEPCPIGVLVSRRRHGRCAALEWQAESSRYVCGVLAAADGRIARRWPRLGEAWRRYAARSISAGSGCDAALETAPAA